MQLVGKLKPPLWLALIALAFIGGIAAEYSGIWSGMLALSWWGYLIVALAATHITIIAVTIYLHRHQAHGALRLHSSVAHFFRFWLWLTTGMHTKEWVATHRKHHAKCETEDDPHSPDIHLRRIKTRSGRLWFMLTFILWRGTWSYVRESRNEDTKTRYGHGTPSDWIERNVYASHRGAGLIVLALMNLGLFGASWGLIIWLIEALWIPVFAAGVINGIGHAWGYRNFESGNRRTGLLDTSKNIVPLGILIGGEELHNNHHEFPTSAKLSTKWYEFDIGWCYIRMLECAGLAQTKYVLGEQRQ